MLTLNVGDKLSGVTVDGATMSWDEWRVGAMLTGDSLTVRYIVAVDNGGEPQEKLDPKILVENNTLVSIDEGFVRAVVHLIYEVRHAPVALINQAGEARSPDSLSGARIAAFCGIGNPAGFRGTLRACGYHPVAWRAFADHHKYRTRDAAWLTRWARRAGADALVCTEKDLVKFDAAPLAGVPLWAVRISLELLAGGEEFTRRLAALLPAPRSIQAGIPPAA